MPVDIKPAEKTVTSLPPQPQADIDPVQIEATNCSSFRDSLILILNGVAAQITDAKDDPNMVVKVAARLKERAGTYADAAVANTQYAVIPTVETDKGKTEREAKDKKEASNKPADKPVEHKK